MHLNSPGVRALQYHLYAVSSQIYRSILDFSPNLGFYYVHNCLLILSACMPNWYLKLKACLKLNSQTSFLQSFCLCKRQLSYSTCTKTLQITNDFFPFSHLTFNILGSLFFFKLITFHYLHMPILWPFPVFIIAVFVQVTIISYWITVMLLALLCVSAFASTVSYQYKNQTSKVV